MRQGTGPTIFTIGYERRCGEDLIGDLLNAGVEALVDVRERPMSRKPDFRKAALQDLCEDSGIRYESWPRLGSTAHQRISLRDTGDLPEFRRRFRDLAKRRRAREIGALAHLARGESIALICYERVHSECHRSIVADLVADLCDASVVAIL
ncbi:MAG: DUF488 domain-containing protein [Phycisphaerales bacterium]|nr:DUF488 domain-containing protein [Phycisphaerales bacterium]